VITKTKKANRHDTSGNSSHKGSCKVQAQEQIKTKATNLLNGLLKQPKKSRGRTKTHKLFIKGPKVNYFSAHFITLQSLQRIPRATDVKKTVPSSNKDTALYSS
jgi:hypothetical protein